MQHDDLAAELLIEAPPETLMPPQSQHHPKQPRLRRLTEPFVQVPLSWFTTDPRPCPFGQRERLLLLLLHLSRWGQRPVTLTSAVAQQIGLSRKERRRHLAQLEADGWVRVTRNGHKALVVCPIIIAG
jgi:hypothetical protein